MLTPIPYKLDAYHHADGKWYGKLSYGATVVAEVERGLDSERQLEKWARAFAHAHKAANSAADTHTLEKTFTL